MTRPRPPRYGWAAQPLDPEHVTVPRPARWRPTEGGTVLYRPPGPGLRRKLRGLVLAVTPGWASIRPAHGGAAVTVPWRHLRALQSPRARVRPATAPRGRPLIAPLVSSVTLIAGPVLITGIRHAQIDPSFGAWEVSRPVGRILDPAYLAWVRTLDCPACGPDQRTQTEPHHLGPRAYGLKTHDWLTVALCHLCHRQHHRTRTLPGCDAPDSAAAFLLAEQLRQLLRYFANPLSEDADRWARLGAVANPMPAAEQVQHLRQVLDLLVQHLWALRGARRG